MRNHQINKSDYLLNEDGSLKEPGFSFRPITVYNREKIRASRLRTKEWDYFLAMNDDYGIAVTISDLGYLRMASVSFLDFAHNREVTRTVMAKPVKEAFMPKSSSQGHVLFKSGQVFIEYDCRPEARTLHIVFENFYNRSPLMADLVFEPLNDISMNIAIPFSHPHQFYFNRKHNCLKTSGTVAFNFRLYEFHPEKDMGVLDWGRGVWPYHVHWYWATGSGYLDGVPFGLNLGYGFGDTSASSENMVFYDGKGYKLDDIKFTFDDPMKPWQITSSDSRFEGVFYPELDRKAEINLGIIQSNQHQYFGYLNARVVLDPQHILEVNHFRTAIESLDNRY